MREKLNSLLYTAEELADKRCDGYPNCDNCPADNKRIDCMDWLKADCLLSLGVTVQEWISVTDDLPKLILCGAGMAYSEAVNVLTSGRKVLTAIWDGFDWTCDAEFWDAEDEEITHWTPVLLPLPEPPKGE